MLFSRRSWYLNEMKLVAVDIIVEQAIACLP